MFNPTSLDEVCVQAPHLEARGKNTFDEDSNFKNKGKKRVANSRKEKESSFASTVQRQVMMKIIVGSFILN